MTENHHQQPTNNIATNSWTPATVEDLIFRQFLKGEDVSSGTPRAVEIQKLPEHDASLRSLFKYCDSNSNNAMNIVGSNTNGATNNKTPANNGQQQQRSNSRPPQQQNGVAVPPNSANNNQNRNKSMPRTPRTNNNNTKNGDGMPAPTNPTSSNANNNNSSSSTQNNDTRRRRFDWPVSIPNDTQLKGTSRSQLQPYTERRIAAQADVDPDVIFRQEVCEFPLTQIFQKYPGALKLITQARGLSGDWRNDTFTTEEEADYKAQMGFTVIGPSQAQPHAPNVTFF